MERIEIKGFLTIDHADFEIKKINILIGAQAQGKSVIAKLIYFFKKYFSDVFYQSIQKLATKQEIEKKCLIQFEQIFPRYSWTNQEFSIVYKNEDVEVSITKAKTGKNPKFNYSKELSDFHKELKNSYKLALNRFSTEIEPEIEKKIPARKEFIFHDSISEKINDSIFSSIFKESIFVPAGRSFFATLQKNVFSFLVNDIDIDTFIKEFGSRLEQMKRFHEIDQVGLLRHDKANDAFRKKIDKLISDIVSGEYLYVDEQDWILNKGIRTNLANASSGQQESLPMLLILKIWPLVFGSKISFFIEEPEAHLFPVSQKQIISLIATIYNTFGHSFFITTHSPYILTAINTLVVGQDAYDKANGDTNKLKKLEKVLATDELIRLEDVSAYTLNKGKLESIIDLENRLIGANLLDAVSDEFDAAFGVATEILYGTD
jgi:predicted ATPase